MQLDCRRLILSPGQPNVTRNKLRHGWVYQRTHGPVRRPDPGRGAHLVARFGLGVAQLESEPWCGTVDASLLIDEIDRPRHAGRGR